MPLPHRMCGPVLKCLVFLIITGAIRAYTGMLLTSSNGKGMESTQNLVVAESGE